jgi:hypothetical protein
MNEYAQHLAAEMEAATAALQEAQRLEIASGYEIDATMERQYWTGYVYAINNAMHALTGMGDN